MHSYFKENFSDFYEPQFARELGKVTFVPAVQYHHGGPEATGAAAGSVMLVKYEDVVVAKDANLAFTQMPMLAEAACPPQVMYSNLGIMSPPPITVVLAHLRTLVDNGAWLNDWDFTGDGPIAVFSSIFKYLEDNYDKLSPRIKEALSSTALIPVGSSLIEVSRRIIAGSGRGSRTASSLLIFSLAASSYVLQAKHEPSAALVRASEVV